MKLGFSSYVEGYTNDQEAISNFRQSMCSYLDCRKIIPVTNGTHAIEIALRGSGLKRGDAVIIPDISFIATATAVADSGLIPVYADVDPGFFGLSLESLRERYSPVVKAVIVVHFSGFVNRHIFGIKEFCREKNLVLIEDCAQSFSGSASGTKTGALGDLGTFSFQSSKILNAGEGGMISTKNEQLGAECEAVADWGMSPTFPQRRLDMASSNFRLSAIQCFHLTRQLNEIHQITTTRRTRVEELISCCDKRGIETAFPRQNDDFIDCPFFFPIKSEKRINLIEPREESPMHKSLMVKAIIDRFFPDLAGLYYSLNPSSVTEGFNSLKVVAETNFINISQTAHLSPDDIFSVYG